MFNAFRAEEWVKKRQWAGLDKGNRSSGLEGGVVKKLGLLSSFFLSYLFNMYIGTSKNMIIGIIISLLFQSGFVFMSQISRNTYHIATQPTTEDVNNKRRTTIHRHTLRIMVFFKRKKKIISAGTQSFLTSTEKRK
jgi:hypothetical protein